MTQPSQGVPSFLSRLELPIAWEPLADAPSDRTLEAAEQANASLLSFLLQEVEVEARPRPADEQLVEALAPLVAKLDVVIELVTRLSYRDLERPARHALELGERQISWHATEAPQPGSWLRIRLYFHPTFLEPVILFGQVGHGAQNLTGDAYRIEVNLAELSERIVNDLHRLAFLTQRRQRLHSLT